MCLVRIVGLPGDPGIGARLAKYLGIEHISVFSKKFPDGEIYLRILEEIENENVLVVQSMYPVQGDRLVELLLALEVLNRYRNKVSVLITYLAYARQDREFLKGEPISLFSIIRAMKAQGLNSLITIDAHNPLAVKEAIGSTRYFNLLPGEIFAEVLLGKYKATELTVVAPDQGATERATLLASKLGCGYVVVKKVRDKVTGQVSHTFDSLDTVSDVAVIVDDIISTGGTIAGIASYLRNRGTKTVVVASHALLVGDAYERLIKAGVEEIYSIPTIPHTFSSVVYVDVVPFLIRKLGEEGILT